MTRILFFGDSAQTGFGTVTWDLGTRLLALGDDVRFISTNQSEEPIPHPVGERTWDAGRTNPAAVIMQGFRNDNWRPEAVLIVSDFVGLRIGLGLADPQVRAIYQQVPSFHYCPVEGIDLPPRWNDVWSVIRPIAMSEFGATEMAKVVGYRPPVVYHGVDPDVFYPVSMSQPGRIGDKAIVSKDGAKAALKYPADRIMVLRTDRHMPRKQYNRMLRGMVKVFDAVPDVDMVIHCRTQDQGGDLEDSISKLSEAHKNRVFLTRAHDSYKGFSRPTLNVLYNAADIYASTSAEGFGLTIAEALAAGVPAVGLDYSAVPEVIGPAGVLIPSDHLVDNEYDHFWASVDEDAFTEAIIRLARKPHERRELGKRGPTHIRTSFSWDRAAEQMSAIVGQRASEEAAA